MWLRGRGSARRAGRARTGLLPRPDERARRYDREQHARSCRNDAAPMASSGTRSARRRPIWRFG